MAMHLMPVACYADQCPSPCPLPIALNGGRLDSMGRGENPGNWCEMHGTAIYFFFGPTTEQRYISPSEESVISPLASASSTSSSDWSWRGGWPEMNSISTSSQSGLKPSP